MKSPVKQEQMVCLPTELEKRVMTLLKSATLENRKDPLNLKQVRSIHLFISSSLLPH